MGELSRRDFTRMAAGGVALETARSRGLGFQTHAESDIGPASLTISETGRRMRAGEITSVALTESCLERAKIYNPKINAYITLMRDQALAKAAQLDAEAKAGKFRS